MKKGVTMYNLIYSLIHINRSHSPPQKQYCFAIDFSLCCSYMLLFISRNLRESSVSEVCVSEVCGGDCFCSQLFTLKLALSHLGPAE